jgi:hypothetical protein
VAENLIVINFLSRINVIFLHYFLLGNNSASHAFSLAPRIVAAFETSPNCPNQTSGWLLATQRFQQYCIVARIYFRFVTHSPTFQCIQVDSSLVYIILPRRFPSLYTTNFFCTPVPGQNEKLSLLGAKTYWMKKSNFSYIMAIVSFICPLSRRLAHQSLCTHQHLRRNRIEQKIKPPRSVCERERE